MNRNLFERHRRVILIVLGLLSLIIVAAMVMSFNSRTDAPASSDDKNSQNLGIKPEKEAHQEQPTKQEPDQKPIVSQPAKLVDYSEEEFNKTGDTRLLFFHASWCPQCLALEKSIKEAIASSEAPSGVTIFKVDFDSSQKLRQKYGVTLQTTVVKVGTGGENEGKFIAYDEPNFSAVRKELL